MTLRDQSHAFLTYRWQSRTRTVYSDLRKPIGHEMVDKKFHKKSMLAQLLYIVQRPPGLGLLHYGSAKTHFRKSSNSSQGILLYPDEVYHSANSSKLIEGSSCWSRRLWNAIEAAHFAPASAALVRVAGDASQSCPLSVVNESERASDCSVGEKAMLNKTVKKDRK